MAKWGEGDPRWIVEERPDATNVNNWHWTEKNADTWSKKKLSELFVNWPIKSPGVGSVLFTEMTKCEGEARANNRKGKLIFFYEWDLQMAWKGRVDGDSDVVVDGTVEIPNLSEEHELMDDVDIDVTVTTKGSEAEALKEMLRKGEGASNIRQRLHEYVKALKTEFCDGLILPAKDSTPGKKTAVASVPKAIANVEKNPRVTQVHSSINNLAISGSGKVATATVELKETFKCTGQELYNVLTQKDMMAVFTGGAVTMEEGCEPEKSKNAKFEMMGGSIQGVFIGLVPFTEISQKWRLKSWPEGHYSIVEFSINQKQEDTELSLKQTGVPEKELDKTRMGWSRYYWEPIKRTFGFGSSLF